MKPALVLTLWLLTNSPAWGQSDDVELLELAAQEVYAQHIPSIRPEPLNLDALRDCRVPVVVGNCWSYAKATWAIARCKGVHPEFLVEGNHAWVCVRDEDRQRQCVDYRWPYAEER